MTRNDQDKKPDGCTCNYPETTNAYGDTYRVHERNCRLAQGHSPTSDPDNIEFEWETDL